MSNAAFQRYQQFEHLCADLFTAAGFEVDREVVTNDRQSIDIIARKQDIELFVEVKLVSAISLSLGRVRDLVAKAKSQVWSPDRPQRGLCILSPNVEPEHLEWVKSEFEIDVWDRQALFEVITGIEDQKRREEVFNRFKGFFEEFESKSRKPKPPTTALKPKSTRPGKDALSRDAAPPIAEVIDEGRDPKSAGKALKGKLNSVPSGKGGATQFEQVVKEIIDHLFGDYLVDPRPQSRSEDGLDIMDIVYRVRTGHPFWDTLTRDFRSRAVIFECKNYSNPITPTQVYSTERYVHVGALRSVCFLVSRHPPSEHAELAAFGSLREGGKLFVFLDDELLGEMLLLRDAQLRLQGQKAQMRDFSNDPAEVLDQRIYDFLTRAGR